MSVRNRPRNGPTKDEDEEINMYNQIKKDIEKLATMQKRSIEITEKIKKKEVEMADLDKARSKWFSTIFSRPYLFVCKFSFFATLLPLLTIEAERCPQYLTLHRIDR